MSEQRFDRDAALERARSLYHQRQWPEACRMLQRAQRGAALSTDDLERLVWASALAGEDEEFLRALERLHDASLEAEQTLRAARAAFWIGFRLLSVGEPGRATGWLTRAQRLVDREASPCVERGYLLLPSIHRHLGAGEDAAAHDTARDAAEVGERLGDPDLVALARNLQGRALLRQGRCSEGLALLDEAMLAATSGALSAMVTGIVYCSVIATCQQICAIDRAREWTAALTDWCDAQPHLVTFTGNCRVNRSELMQIAGAWSDAMKEVERICDGVAEDKDPDVFADACYQRAEIHRLRGEFASAESSYRAASESGRDPHPGLALLRLAQGRLDAARGSIRRVLQTTKARWRRAQLLPAFIEIMVAGDELAEAESACIELEEIAELLGTPAIRATAEHMQGALKLAQGDAEAAVPLLRQAFATWNRIGAPYVTARIRALLCRAFAALGDREGADLELSAARAAFAELGAAPALSALRTDGGRETFGLSKRELEVLCLVASGKTNRVIARELHLSERTVDRHVSNIFAKIGVSSRAAATAFAYRNGMV